MYKREVLALILAGGEGKRLDILSEKRAKPAVPFGGKYRIIDFPLSNCVNSGLYCVGIPTQYNPRSLHEHIGIGKFWDLDRMEAEFSSQPYIRIYLPTGIEERRIPLSKPPLYSRQDHIWCSFFRGSCIQNGLSPIDSLSPGEKSGFNYSSNEFLGRSSCLECYLLMREEE